MRHTIKSWSEKVENYFNKAKSVIRVIDKDIEQLRELAGESDISRMIDLRNKFTERVDMTEACGCGMLEGVNIIQNTISEGLGKIVNLHICLEQLEAFIHRGMDYCELTIKGISEIEQFLHLYEDMIFQIFRRGNSLERRFEAFYEECYEMRHLCRRVCEYIETKNQIVRIYECAESSMVPAIDMSLNNSSFESSSSLKSNEVPGIVTSLEGNTFEDFTPQTLQMDSVCFSAVTNSNVVPGDYLSIDVVMYEDEFREVVESLLNNLDEQMQEKPGGYQDVERNSNVRVVLSSPDVDGDDAVEERRWCGKFLTFDFAVYIPEEYKKKQILFVASIYINNVIASKLKLIVKCDRKTGQKIEVLREDITSAFISYASQDSYKVAIIIQGIQKARPDMDIFFAASSLRSGQYWEEVLQKEIGERDIFYLCWSEFAKKSKWVEMEWRYALECKGEEFIDPIPIDSPIECPPPEELNKKHFNDKLLYFIKAMEAEK